MKAGIRGSMVDFLAEGPIEGDPNALESRPTDPLVVEWKRSAILLLTASAKKGDVESLSQLSTTYQMGTVTERDPQLALAYPH